MSAIRAVVFFALAFASPAWTLVSTTRPSTARHTSRMSTAVAPRLKMKSPIPKALNPFDWSIERPPRSTPKVEGAELYRMIGIAPEAEYEEIQAKAKLLAVKYEKDPKKKIKIEIAYDKIVELRLRQAAAGKLMVNAASIREDAKWKARETEAPKKNRVPVFARGVIVYPVPKARAIQCAKFIAAPGLGVAALVPFFSTQMRVYIVIASLQMVYTRGRKPPPTEDGMPLGRQDFPTGEEFKRLVLITGTTMFAGFGVAVAAGALPFVTYGPRLSLTVMTLFGYAQTCLCRIYKDKEGKKKKAA